MKTYSLKRGIAFMLIDMREWKETYIKNPKMRQFLIAGNIKIKGIRCITFADEFNVLWAQPEFIALDKNKIKNIGYDRYDNNKKKQMLQSQFRANLFAKYLQINKKEN